MAIDTVNKRRSTLKVISSVVPLPVPDGNINEGDRIHIWNYRGIDMDPPARILIDRGNLRGIGSGILSGNF